MKIIYKFPCNHRVLGIQILGTNLIRHPPRSVALRQKKPSHMLDLDTLSFSRGPRPAMGWQLVTGITVTTTLVG